MKFLVQNGMKKIFKNFNIGLSLTEMYIFVYFCVRLIFRQYKLQIAQKCLRYPIIIIYINKIKLLDQLMNTQITSGQLEEHVEP
jgi:hypothetical protein